MFRKFTRCSQGNLAVITAVSAAVLTGAAGVAVLFNQGNASKARMQAGLDAAVLAGTAMSYGATDDERVSIAEKMFASNVSFTSMIGDTDGDSEFEADTTSTSTTFIVTNHRVRGSAVATIKNTLPAALGISDLTVSASARAEKLSSDPICMLSVDPDSEEAFALSGTASLDTDCAVQVNSTDDAAMAIDGTHASGKAKMFGVTGKATGDGWSPNPLTGTEPVADPYADLPVPTPTACGGGKAGTIKSSGSLDPGTYCGGLTIKTGATVTLNPGIYIMVDGEFRVDSGGSVVGESVLIVLYGEDSIIYMGSDSTAVFTSPTEGTYKNIQFMSDRDLTQSKFEEETSTIGSGASLEYDGVMYLPEQGLEVSGTAHQTLFKGYSPTMSLVSKTVSLQGNINMTLRREDRRGIGMDETAVSFAYGARLVE